MLPAAAKIEEAVARLNAGALVAFPTETVYGLGADASNPSAVGRIFAVKGRPATHPLIVHFSNFEVACEYASEVPDAARRLAEAFWPGPLTLVLPKSARVPAAVTGGQSSVALRAPAHPVARALLAAFGRGIAAPSANRYGRISPTRAADVRDELGDAVLVLDGGECEVGLESTIVACLGGRVTLLRPGSISRSQVADVVGRVEDPGPGAPRAPGSNRTHYAPGTQLAIVAAESLRSEIDAALAGGERVAVLARAAAPVEAANVVWRGMPADPVSYGRALYAALRGLDGASADRILVEAVPAGEAWAAVADRLARAAARDTPADGVVDAT